MRYLFLAIVFLLFSCKQFTEKKERETIVEINQPIIAIEKELKIPEGAVIADFFGNNDSIYAFVEKVDTAKQTTLIAFEKKYLPEIIIPESIGAELQILKLKNFTNNVLLVNAKLKDTNFNEYYLFIWKDSVWKQAVNRFAIHKSNMLDSLTIITNNPKDSTKLLRYYSVFNMDSKSEKKFTWKLMQESVSIED